ncbi:MAG: CBS domain-containing protein [Nitrospirae bacterium]|nr:MAG: CBS domain-containing protein [Nitrospirota bacterium]
MLDQENKAKGMKFRRAGDLMVPLDRYPHLPYWFTLRQAVVAMLSSEVDVRGRKSLPRVVLVFDEEYSLLGFVRRRDILRGLEPAVLANVDVGESGEVLEQQLARLFDDANYEGATTGIRERAEKAVRTVMQPIVATADCEDHMMKLVLKMVSHDLHLLPVLRDGSVVGVVRTVDIFEELAQYVL